MFSLCVIDQTSEELDQWLYLSWGFGSPVVYSRGMNSSKATNIASLSELPAGPLIVVQPESGAHIAGTQSLAGHTHLDNAIYLFGGSNSNMAESDLSGLTPAETLCIPATAGIEIHAPLAGAIVLWDRYAKRGGFG